MSVTQTMMDMHADPAVVRVTTARSSTKRKFTEYGQYFARQWRDNEATYRGHYADADAYRLDIMRKCWPLVGDHCKRYFREAFNAELHTIRT